jgi:choline dehydrogenase-like flavoprotein
MARANIFGLIFLLFLAIEYTIALDVHVVDFFIAGSGTAGSVLAGKLASHQRNGWRKYYQVGVYETGGFVRDLPDPDVVNNLSRELEAANYGPIERNYTTVPIDFRGNATIPIKRVLGLGGCHLHNSALNRPGDPAAIDGWGIQGFDYAALSPYIKEVVDFIPATTLLPLTNIQQATREHLFNKSGYPLVSDTDAKYQTIVGIQRTYYTAKLLNSTYAKRVTTSQRYLLDNPRLGKNLHIYTRMELVRFQINRHGRILYAVVKDLVRNRLVHVIALREYILSGGWVDSPLALMRSGVGNCTELEALGIDCKVDLPHVGKNYMYHLAGVTLRRVDPFWMANGSLPIQRSNVMIALSMQPNGTIGNVVNGIIDIRQDPNLIPQLGIVAMSVALNMRDFGPGEVTLDPSNHMKPIIDPKLFQGEQGQKDLEFMVDLIVESRRLMDMIPFYGPELSPGLTAFPDRASLFNYIKQRVSDGAHGVGTCRRANTRSQGVVGADCRVFGMRNLCISDASTMPVSPAGNTNSITASIAAHDADRIIDRHEFMFPDADDDEFDFEDDN